MKMFLAILLSALLCACGSSTPASEPETSPQKEPVFVPVFNEDSAYCYIQRQVDFGYRIPNTEAHAKAAQYLASELKRHGAEVFVQEAPVKTYDGTLLNGKNIIASFDPDKKERVLLFAHWDSRPYADEDADPANHYQPIEGANDGGSGTGVLLEIARQISQAKPRIGIDIILFDAEDYGRPAFLEEPATDNGETWALGSQYWAKHPHKPGYKAKYGILLDMVGGTNATFHQEAFSLRFAPSVVKKVWKTAQSIGYGSYFPTTQGGGITDDHLFVNDAGIPSIDIIDLRPDNFETGFYEHWHTVNDTMENIDRATLKAVGQTVLTVIYNE